MLTAPSLIGHRGSGRERRGQRRGCEPLHPAVGAIQVSVRADRAVVLVAGDPGRAHRVAAGGRLTVAGRLDLRALVPLVEARDRDVLERRPVPDRVPLGVVGGPVLPRHRDRGRGLGTVVGKPRSDAGDHPAVGRHRQLPLPCGLVGVVVGCGQLGVQVPPIHVRRLQVGDRVLPGAEHDPSGGRGVHGVHGRPPGGRGDVGVAPAAVARPHALVGVVEQKEPLAGGARRGVQPGSGGAVEGGRGCRRSCSDRRYRRPAWRPIARRRARAGRPPSTRPQRRFAGARG